MKNKSLILASVLILSLSSTPNASAQWVQTNGPPSTAGGDGDILAFAMIDSNLFAGTYGEGVFLTTDNGENWTPEDTGLTNPNVECLAVSGTNLFAGTEYGGVVGSGVYLSNNNGTSWTAAGNGLTSPHGDVFALAAIGTNLFAGTDGGVYLSTNNGAIWTLDTTGMGLAGVNALAVSGTNLFAGSGDISGGGTGNGIFRSTNNGTTWVATSSGLPYNSTLDVYYTITALAASGTNLFAGGYGIFLSTDSGVSWNNVGLTDSAVSAIAVIGTNLFAGTNQGNIFLSTNNGANWTSESSGMPDVKIDAFAVSNGNLFIGASALAGPPGGAYRRPLSEMIHTSSVSEMQTPSSQIQSYPNPCTSSSTITFSCAESGESEVTILNLLGAEVARVYEGELSAGEHSFTWDATGAAPGMYECVVNVNGNVQRTAISLLK